MTMSKLELAKAKIALHAPEFTSLLCKLQIVRDDTISTAYTDGRKIGYNQAFVDSLHINEVLGILFHEVGHNMCAHMARMGNRDKHRANVAMDIVLNQNLIKYFEELKAKSQGSLDARLPADAIFGPQYDKYLGWNWEAVYADEDFIKQCPSIPQFDFVMPGKGDDGQELSAAQQDALAKEWAMAAQTAAQIAKKRGFKSSFFESFVAGLTETKVDWYSQLWDAATKVAHEDFSFRRFNRKHIYNETYLAGRYNERIGKVLLGTDTSGSMADESFKYALGAVNEVFAELKPDGLTFICCDTDIKSVEELSQDDLPIQQKAFKGRGGTTLTPIFEFVKAQHEKYDLVIILTDGEHDVIDKSLEPDCPVVWLICGNATQAAENSFGKVIRV